MNHTHAIRVPMLITNVILQNPKRALVWQLSGQTLRPKFSSWGGHHELDIVGSNPWQHLSPADTWFRFFFPGLQAQFSFFIDKIWKKNKNKKPQKHPPKETQESKNTEYVVTFLFLLAVLCTSGFLVFLLCYFSGIRTVNVRLWKRRNPGSAHTIFCVSHS